MNQHLERKKPFKILAIDGGGIKGLYSSKILEHLEEKFKCSISDHFDMICGTSTGGLIALALSLKIPANEISKFYIEYGPKIFPYRSFIGGIIRQVFWNGKYSDKPLKEALNRIFDNKKIGDVNNLLCIPSYSLTDAKPWVFKYDYRDDLDRDNNTSCVDVALATSAAPTYFPLCEIERYNQKQFIDGGVWANNPTLVGVLEALAYFVGENKEFDSIEILSISSLNNPSGKPVGLKRNRSFLHWRKDLFETTLIGQSHFTHFTMQKLSELNQVKIKYVRIESEIVGAEQIHLVDLDLSSKKSISFLEGKGNDKGRWAKNQKEIGDFFTKEKLHKIKNNG